MLKYFKGVFGMAPLKGASPKEGFSKTAPAPLLFAEKWLLQKNIWQSSSRGAKAEAGEKPCQTGPKCLFTQPLRVRNGLQFPVYIPNRLQVNLKDERLFLTTNFLYLY
jgi:hypothetical protein